MVLVRSAQLRAMLICGVVSLAGLSSAAHANPTGGTTERDGAAMAWPVVADPNVDPVVFAVSQRLDSGAIGKRFHPDDIAALKAYYKPSQQSGAVWISDEGFSDRARKAAAELASADDWGLKSDDYQLPRDPGATATPDEKAAAELEFGLTVLKYARHARQGRVRPTSVTRINDFPGLSAEDARDMWRDLSQSTDVQSYLRDLHPKHPQFKRLRQALLKARGQTKIETGALPTPKPSADGGSQVTLPRGTDLTPGMQHKDIVLLRERLGVKADVGANSHYFDAPLAEALEAFQSEAGLVATGNLDEATRKRLNAVLTKAEDAAAETADTRAAPRKTQNNSRRIQLILNNMERWRWLPDDLGSFYVWNNVPEFQTRVYKNDDIVFSEKIIVGLPEWATPSFMADMKYVIFRPSWGVPRGIKLKELLPRLKRAQPQSLFDFFGGGGGGTQAVLKAYNLNVYKNGKQINPNGIKWNSSNILNYSFIQPAGGKNPLGIVKFRFPNKHNVYMHDTIERELFGKARRTYSHGCIRVRNPVKLAEVLLSHDQGSSAASVRSMVRSGRSVTLKEDIPVYVSYMTARVDDKGVVHTYGDIYGRDGRLARQLGREMRFDQPKVAKPNKKNSSTRTARKKRKKKKKAASSGHRIPSSMNQAISGRYN